MPNWINDQNEHIFIGTRNPYMDYNWDEVADYCCNDVLATSSFVSQLGYNTRPRTGTVYPKDLIKKVIFNNPCTIVIWIDETKTIVKAEGEPFDQEKGLAMAISKKFFGNTGNYYEVFKKWIPKEERP